MARHTSNTVEELLVGANWLVDRSKDDTTTYGRALGILDRFAGWDRSKEWSFEDPVGSGYVEGWSKMDDALKKEGKISHMLS